MPCALYWVGAGGRGAWVPDQVLGAAGEGSGAASTDAPGQGRSRGGSPGACGATASPARPGPRPRSRPLRGAPPPPAARPGPGASSRAPVRAPSCHSAPSPAPRILGAAAREPPESSLRRPGRATGPTAASASCCRSAAEKSSRILVWGRAAGRKVSARPLPGTLTALGLSTKTMPSTFPGSCRPSMPRRGIPTLPHHQGPPPLGNPYPPG